MQIRRHVAVLAALLVGLTLASSASAATIKVTTTADDLTPNDGSVSLREAITAINAGNNLGDPDITAQAPGTFGSNDTINFNIPGSGLHRILVGQGNSFGSLPTIVRPMLIDGTSQPGASVNTLANADNAVTQILLDGSSAGPNATGLFLAGGSATIKGLDVFGFGGGDIAIRSSVNAIVDDDIGFDLSGAPAQSPHGVLIQDAGFNTIGGTTPAARNLISGNSVDGVEILGTNNTVQGNFIGAGPTGTSALGNGAGAPAGAGGGVQLIGADNNTIGGTVLGARNVIVGNGVAGILDNGAQNNVIQGNFVGVGADGVTPVPNATGVWLTDTNPASPAKGNLIGGTVAGAGNLIEFNSGAGIALSGTPATGNGILGNSIFANGGLGIDLGNDGVTPNSPVGVGGFHTGPNNLQNFPLITTVSFGPSSTTIQGTLNATPSTAFRLEFFASTACDASGFGEGQEFIGFANVTTDGSGNASFNVPIGFAIPASSSISASATDPSQDTSEFSRCFPPIAAPTTTPIVTGLTNTPPHTVTPRVTLRAAKVQKDGSITVTGTTTVAGKISASGTVGGKGSTALSKHGRKRHKTPVAKFGPTSKTLTAAGSFTLKLKPNSTALAQLRSGKRLTVTVTLTLSSAGGSGPLSSTKAKVSDRLPQKRPLRRH
jgi:CSLREA domain-containing protein